MAPHDEGIPLFRPNLSPEAIDAIAGRHGLPVLGDCAHATGASYRRAYELAEPGFRYELSDFHAVREAS